MQESDRLGIAAHLHVQLRRLTGRVTDTEWMARNLDYADEVVRFARETALDRKQPELAELAKRLEAAMQPLRPAPKPARAVSATPREEAPAVQGLEARYVGRLR